jgi:oligopeptide/dipeptide ABC transporter ATP-binding protein
VLLADEPTSMLDVSIRATIQGLLASLQRDREIALVYVTHDLRSARRVAPVLLVMHAGRVVERGPVEAVLTAPAHPYARALLAALPGSRIPALAPSEGAPFRGTSQGGCSFVGSCPRALEKCARVLPPLEALTDEPVALRTVRCHAPLSRQY